MMRQARNVREVNKRRTLETRDVVKRIGVIPPTKVRLANYPIEFPQAAFNPAAHIIGDEVYIYMRIEVGYYTYSSAISLSRIPISDFISGKFNDSTLQSRLVVLPSTRNDIWGTEDPRITEVSGAYYMVYTGRTVSYPDESALLRYLPIVAVSKDGEYWEKFSALYNDEFDPTLVIGDKDAFIVKRDDTYYVFHRPSLLGGKHLVVASKAHMAPEKSRLYDTRVILEQADFEEKVGWGTPTILVEGKSITFLHGVDRDIKAYRVFAASIGWSNDGPYVDSVTPHYIMGPREVYEVYGDRPYTVFPTAALIIDNNIYIIYGAGDMMVGVGVIEASQLLYLLGY